MGLIQNLALSAKEKIIVPECVINFIFRHFRCFNIRRAFWLAKDPYADAPPQSSYEPKYPYVLGIVKEFFHEHWPYISACRELGVAYKVLDISGPDWIDVVEQSQCDAFLIWPSVQMTIWKQMYEERLKIMTEELGKLIYPSYKEVWIYESKRKMYYWLRANRIPHARTWVFYDLDQALDFANNVELPIVFKSDSGSGASGVNIFRSRAKLLRFVKKCFRKGFNKLRGYSLDRQWGNILFQEYLPGVKEWRMIRIEDSYFGHQKGQIGDFHSGTDIVIFAEPPEKLLNFVREVTHIGEFSSMNLDIFETSDGRYLVNELQTVFGPDPAQMKIGGKFGRYIYNQDRRQWVFEEGVFWQNNCCNIRVENLIRILDNEEKK